MNLPIDKTMAVLTVARDETSDAKIIVPEFVFDPVQTSLKPFQTWCKQQAGKV